MDPAASLEFRALRYTLNSKLVAVTTKQRMQNMNKDFLLTITYFK